VWLAQEEQFTLRVEAEEEVISVYLFLAILLHQASGFVKIYGNQYGHRGLTSKKGLSSPVLR
jgi:hypothetical protein